MKCKIKFRINKNSNNKQLVLIPRKKDIPEKVLKKFDESNFFSPEVEDDFFE